MGLYGYESFHSPRLVVSFIGRSWIMHWPVEAAQSTRACRSRNSPIPKSSALCKENIGMTVPAPRNPGMSNFAALCFLGKGHPGIGESIHLSVRI